MSYQELRCPDPWFRIGPPDLATLHQFRSTGRRLLTPAELLLYVEAELRLCDGDDVLFTEPSFEVAELAVLLGRWASGGTEPDEDFELDAPDEAAGVLRISRARDGWVAGSVFAARTTGPQPWPVVRDFIDIFAAEARQVAARSLVAAGWAITGTAHMLSGAFDLPQREAWRLVVAAGAARWSRRSETTGGAQFPE